DAHAAFDNEVFAGRIQKDRFDFAAVIGVDCSGGIEDGYAVFRGKAGAGAYLRLKARRKGNGDAGSNDGAVTGLACCGGVYGRAKTHACRLFGRVSGEREIPGMVKLLD